MIGAVANHIWQSTVFALTAALVVLFFRRHQAQVRYWIWFSASVKFLVPFAALIAIGGLYKMPSPSLIATHPSLVSVSSAAMEATEPFVESAPEQDRKLEGPNRIAVGLIVTWMIGAAVIVFRRLRDWFRIKQVVRQSTPLQIAGITPPEKTELRETLCLLEPGVVGWFRSTLLLPAGIVDRLTRRQLETVLAHELSHIQRRDNLKSAIHMTVEALFWFHPLVWYIGARLVDERELACDENVLRLGIDPHEYADGILTVCKEYVASPLRCVSGVTGSDLKKRLHHILGGCIARDLNLANRIILVAASVLSIATPLIVGIVNTPIMGAQSQPTPKFEVASIKPCIPGDGAVRFGPGERGAGRGLKTSPGRLYVNCMSVVDMIDASLDFGDDHLLNNPVGPPTDNPPQIKGGPAWARSDRYTIDAETKDPVANGSTEGRTPAVTLLMGRMLRTLLDDRFQLKTHRETEEVPMYSLTVLPGGLKMQPMKEGGCIPRDPTKGVKTSEMFPPGQTPLCTQWLHNAEADWAIDGAGQKMSVLVGALSNVMGRHVFDKTDLSGAYVYHLRFAHDDVTPGSFPPGMSIFTQTDVPAGPSVFTALEQLGLKLVPDKGPRESLVIDSVQRPTVDGGLRR